MAKEKYMPCDDWSEMLTMSNDELKNADREALESHLASCPTCRMVTIDDAMISKLIQALPEPDFPHGLPPRLSRLIKEKESMKNAQEVHDSSVFLLRTEEVPTKLLKSEERHTESNDKSIRTSSISKQLPLKPDEKVSQLDQQSKGKSHPKGDLDTQRSSKEQIGKFGDQTLYCRDCNQEFVFTEGEREFYASRGLTNAPSCCPSCRAARRASNQGGGYGGHSGGGGGYRDREPRQMYTATCANCGSQAQVPFQPRVDRPVYCSNCYHKHGLNTTHHHSQNFLDK